MPQNFDIRTERWQTIHNILLHEWDPIGIQHAHEAQDEYDSYIPQLFMLLQRQATVPEIAAHLASIESDQMGLQATPARNETIARRLLETAAKTP